MGRTGTEACDAPRHQRRIDANEAVLLDKDLNGATGNLRRCHYGETVERQRPPTGRRLPTAGEADAVAPLHVGGAAAQESRVTALSLRILMSQLRDKCRSTSSSHQVDAPDKAVESARQQGDAVVSKRLRSSIRRRNSAIDEVQRPVVARQNLQQPFDVGLPRRPAK